LDWNEPGGRADGKSNTNPSASESSPSTGPMWPDMETSTMSTALWATPTAHPRTHTPRPVHHGMQLANQVADPALHPSTSLPAASLASRSATPGSGRARTIFAGSGPSSPESLATYDPATSSWRTSQDSWLDTEGWGQSLATWPPSGMTRSGTASQLVPLVRRTSATGSGSWLPDGFWHTPTASDRDGKPHWDHRASPGHVRKVPVPNLMAQVMERWPTPTTRDHKDTGDSVANGTVPVNSLLGRAVGPTTAGGSLNPTWVEWLMGFPLGWTDLGHSETRSSRKSSNG
jgi:hypothetical protein